MIENIPKLFFNGSDEDREAVSVVLDAGVQCNLSGPIADESTPLIVYGERRIVGLDDIKLFIKQLKNGSL